MDWLQYWSQYSFLENSSSFITNSTELFVTEQQFQQEQHQNYLTILNKRIENDIDELNGQEPQFILKWMIIDLSSSTTFSMLGSSPHHHQSYISSYINNNSNIYSIDICSNRLSCNLLTIMYLYFTNVSCMAALLLLYISFITLIILSLILGRWFWVKIISYYNDKQKTHNVTDKIYFSNFIKVNCCDCVDGGGGGTDVDYDDDDDGNLIKQIKRNNNFNKQH